MARRLKGSKATELFKRISIDLRWCDNCGVPVVALDRCGRCGEKVRKVKVVPPGDVRPVSELERSWLVNAISKSVGIDVVKFLDLDRSFILFNRIQGVDAAYEVIVHGLSIGVLEFDIVRKEWIFKPGYYGTKLFIDEGIASCYAVLDVEKLKPYTVVERNKIVEGNVGEPGSWIPVANKNFSEYGVAKVLSQGDVRIQKVWRFTEKKIEISKSVGTINVAVEANVPRLEMLERRALEFLRRTSRLGVPVVNISGGKDSTVAAYLASEAGVRYALFIDSGLEFPETIETAHKVAAVCDLKLFEVRSRDTFWRYVDLFGPPARDYRWCCRICKLAPSVKEFKSKFDRLLTIVGQRRYESTSRALAGQVARSGTISYETIASPIQEWSALEVHLFIAYKNLPLNPLYSYGYDRVGCYLCPTSRLAEFEIMKNFHRDLWERWNEKLWEFCRKWGLPKVWIDLGLWRWRFEFPAEIIQILAKQGVKHSAILEKVALNYVVVAQEFSGYPDLHCLVLSPTVEEVPLDRVEKLLRVVAFDKIEKRGSEVVAYAKRGHVKVSSSGRVEVCSRDVEYLERLARRALLVVYMASQCLGCNLCSYVCTRRAIEKGEVDVSRCSGCAKCAYVCPVASNLSKHGIYLVRRVTHGIKT